ncbi:hypothetical protein D9758_005462 [Tetrapyrgos nigripes]|uniref:Uncharacterized protein n=1 Tax=Tetrapyrgos nigripes TaxID=182062 RepID=A0A8H5GI06_9AGAR|nr:hypothetical protein D9758_005462 [Tetrapyrgos nigripes]
MDRRAQHNSVVNPPSSCQTLEEDETTRCSQRATHASGQPPNRRCALHHEQYCKMTKAYKDASEIVNELGDIPEDAEIPGYTDHCTCLEKAYWLRRYIEAIRTGRTRREIHHRRFFLKIDDGHRMRLKILEEKMISLTEQLRAIQCLGFHLYVSENPDFEWVIEQQFFMSKPVEAESNKGPRDDLWAQLAAEDSVHCSARRRGMMTTQDSTAKTAHADDLEDLIARKHRLDKEKMFRLLEPWLEAVQVDPSEWTTMSKSKRIALIRQKVLEQYGRRIIFYDPTLSFKAIGKVSFKDYFLHPDFSLDDLERFLHYYYNRVGFGLLWYKNAVMEALASLPSQDKSKNLANLGKIDSRFPVLGGWVYNIRQQGPMSNEGWWYLIETLRPPPRVENRFMRVCNSFDDLHAFLSFSALGMIPPAPNDPPEHHVYRRVLSLSGVVVSDMVPTLPPLSNGGPYPTQIPAKKRGCITWLEMESRAYLIGALRNEADDFTEAFLAELRSRPDMFCVVTRSETDPGQYVETFGGLESEPLPQVRTRHFEAPPARFGNAPPGEGNWTVIRSAKDILFGTSKDLPERFRGILTATMMNSRGSYYRFKTFPVKYFAILDATPGRSYVELLREVPWAALRAQGLVEGGFTKQKYAKAADLLVQKHRLERLSWMPPQWKTADHPWSPTLLRLAGTAILATLSALIYHLLQAEPATRATRVPVRPLPSMFVRLFRPCLGLFGFSRACEDLA